MTRDVGDRRRRSRPPRSAPSEIADPDVTLAILFTSGSSGLPKAFELSRRAVIANQQQRAGDDQTPAASAQS